MCSRGITWSWLAYTQSGSLGLGGWGSGVGGNNWRQFPRDRGNLIPVLPSGAPYHQLISFVNISIMFYIVLIWPYSNFTPLYTSTTVQHFGEKYWFVRRFVLYFIFILHRRVQYIYECYWMHPWKKVRIDTLQAYTLIFRCQKVSKWSLKNCIRNHYLLTY